MRSRRCRRIGRRSPPRRCSCSRSTRHCKRRSRCRSRRSRRCCSMISIRRSPPWSRAMRRPTRRARACGAAGSGSLDDHAAHGKRANPMKGLRWRVLLVLSLAAVVPTVIVGMLAILRARHDVQDEVQRGALAHIRALGAALDGTLQDARRTVELAAATWADAPDDSRARQLLVRRLRREVPIVKTLSILSPDGALIAGDPVPAGVDIGSHSFGGYIGDAVFVDERPIVYLVVQARSRTGEQIGVVVAALDHGFVRDVIAAARLGAGAGVPVATSDMTWPSPKSLAGHDPVVDRALASTVEGTLSANGWVSAYRNLSSYQSLRGVRWAIIHQQPEAEAYALARRTTRATLLVGLVALALALAFGAYFATRLTRPLADLARRADAIAAGQATEGPAIRGPGEIGV